MKLYPLLLFVGYLTAAPANLSSEKLIPILSEPAETPEEVFLRLDRNEDNQITFSEFIMKDIEYVHRKMREYAAADINGDNLIDFEEFLQSLNGEKTLAKAKTMDEVLDEEERIGGISHHEKDVDLTSTEDAEQESAETEEVDEQREESEERIPALDKKTAKILRKANADAFEIYDEDMDGLLDEEEMLFMVQDYLECALLVKPHKLIEEYDMNGDGGLDRREMWMLEKDMPEDLIEPFFEFHDEVEQLYEDDLDLDSSEDRVVVFNKYRRRSKD